MADVKIEVRENGPNRVTGPIEIVDASGANYSIPEGRWVSLLPLRGCLLKSLSATARTAMVASKPTHKPADP